MTYHLAAALVGRYGVEPLLFAEENTNAGMPVHFVGREYIEVDIESLHVDPVVQGTLRSVDEYRYLVPVGQVDNLLDGV